MEEKMEAASSRQPGVPALKQPKPLKLKKRRRWRKPAAILAVLALAGAGVFRYLSSAAAPQPSSHYRLEQAVRRDLAISVSGTATLEPADSYNVNALATGEITSAPFEELSTVQKGDLLYTIDAGSVQDSIQSAAISLQQQELSYQRALDARTPKAPIGGTISEVYVKNGDTVNTGDQIAKIVSSTDITADFLFTYVNPGEFYAGQSATVFIDGFAGSTQGTVQSVSDATSITNNGKSACTVRVRIVNPGTLTDAGNYTAQAVIGSYTSYGNTSLSMGGSAVVTAAGSGTVSGFSKLRGSTVQKGETLCTISSEALDEQIQSARLAIESAKLQQSAARDSMDGYRITAPISGTVIQKNFKAGDKVDGVTSGTLAVVYDLSFLKMSMNVNELDIGKVAVGQSVEITAAALPGQSFTGRVDKVSIAGATTNGFTTYPVTIVLEDYGQLRPGMNVSATIQCETARNAVTVPADAVSRGGTVLVAGEGALTADGSSVLDESRLETRNVTIGRSSSEYVEILSGLEEGETVAAPTAADTGTGAAESAGADGADTETAGG